MVKESGHCEFKGAYMTSKNGIRTLLHVPASAFHRALGCIDHSAGVFHVVDEVRFRCLGSSAARKSGAGFATRRPLHALGEGEMFSGTSKDRGRDRLGRQDNSPAEQSKAATMHFEALAILHVIKKEIQGKVRHAYHLERVADMYCASVLRL